MKTTKPTFAIGGIGGSGTRAVAQLLKELGFFIGNDLNPQNDNLLYTLFFKRKNILITPKQIFQKQLELFYKLNVTSYQPSLEEYIFLENLAKNANIQHDSHWLYKRIENLQNKKPIDIRWGWKEPNTHIIIDKILEHTPDLKFIYVYRNGLDMAFSSNQNQLQFWGEIFLNEFNLQITPKNSLTYWCNVHRRMIQLKNSFPHNIFMLDLDNFYLNEINNLKKLFSFLEISPDKTKKFQNIITKPTSLGRYKQYSLDQFDPEDLSYLQSIYTLGN